jgi:hypothetical protein
MKNYFTEKSILYIFLLTFYTGIATAQEKESIKYTTILKTIVLNLIATYPTLHMEQQVSKNMSIMGNLYFGQFNLLGISYYSGLGITARYYQNTLRNQCNGWYGGGGFNIHSEGSLAFKFAKLGLRLDGGHQIVFKKKQLILDLGIGAYISNSVNLRAMVGLGIQLNK